MQNRGKKAVILWLSGAGLSDVCAIAEVETLMQKGITVELAPQPITSTQSHHYQIITGQRPERSGFFDTFTLHDYAVTEQLEGRNRTPETLPILLNNAGWAVSYHEVPLAELVTHVRNWVETVTSFSCLIVKCVISEPITAEIAASIATSIQVAQPVVGETGLLALLSDAQITPVKQFVNVNNFLATMNIIERHKTDRSIDWANTLAYHMGHGQLRVNLSGRNSQGSVHQTEYAEVCEALIQHLPARFCDPKTGQPVIERIYRKEELYTEEYLFCAPDMVISFQPGYAPSPQSTQLAFDRTLLTTPPRHTHAINGMHPSNLTGFLIATAPSFVQDTTFDIHVPLTAVAPTLLHALNARHGMMDSSALQQCFKSGYLHAYPLPLNEPEAMRPVKEEQATMINRLRDLGYHYV